MKKIEVLFIGMICISFLYGAYKWSLFQNEDFSIKLIDDVIHDKYEKNTNEYYRFRIQKDEDLLKHNPESLILYDNLAVAYNQVGETKTALDIYSKKKILMEKKGTDIQNWYRYYANLGTFLIHEGIIGWFKNKNDKYSMDLIIKGRGYIKKAIDINIDAHFGRENYQLIANDWLISSFKENDIILKKNMLGKPTLDISILDSNNNLMSCGKVYYDIYPEAKKIRKSIREQVRDSCPMALKGIVGMIRFGGGPNPYSFSSMGDILTLMGDYQLAFASYARSVKMNHPSSKKIIEYMILLSNKIYPELSRNDAYNKLLNQFNSDYKIGNDWSNNYINYQKNIILEGKNPLEEDSYYAFYENFKHSKDVEYIRGDI